MLLLVPNVSEGSDLARVEALAGSFGPARLLDVHSDSDHGRSVFTLAAPQAQVPAALLGGAREAVKRIDLGAHRGLHPHVGALDVAPVVYVREEDRGAAAAAALLSAAVIGADLELPVFLYGALATAREHVERADLRRGGPRALAERMRAEDLRPDYGPYEAHPTAGAVLVTARPPLLAFNLELSADDLGLAQRVAAALRESGGGLPGVRALGLRLNRRARVQVSINVHDHHRVTLGDVVEFVRTRADVRAAELVGLAPAAALDGYPQDLPLRGFVPEKHVIENALGSL